MKFRNDNPAWQGGLKHFRHTLQFHIKPDRFNEMVEMLEGDGLGLVAKRDYRFKYSDERFADFEEIQLNHTVPVQALLSFRSKKKALLFKLSWQECEMVDQPILKQMLWKIMPSPSKFATIVLGQKSRSSK